MDPDYFIRDPDQIFSPAYVVFRPLVERNIDAMCRLAGDVARLRPHCKTHKMSAVVKMKMQRGITKFKVSTLAEAEMLANAGALDIFLAYNIVGPNIARAVTFCGTFPHVAFYVTADDPDQVAALGQACQGAGAQIGVLLDINPGRDRTGVRPADESGRLYRLIHETPGLYAAGLHLYDGHQRQPGLSERSAAVHEVWRSVKAFQMRLEEAGLPVPRIVCGGTPTFPVYAELSDPVVELSPGTCVFHDVGYSNAFADLGMFKAAAAVLTRVVSRPTYNRLTFDLGSKSIAADPPAGSRALLLGLPEGRQVLQNEEHLVVETEFADRYRPGDWTLAFPTHVCPTSALYREAVVIENGEIVDRWKVDARDRQLTI